MSAHAPRVSPGAPTLLLVPTARERAQLFPSGSGGRGLLELCGFGPVAAAARTGALLARLQPRRVVLLGIAGTYDTAKLPVGTATTFGEVVLDGVGAGAGDDFQSGAALGFAQFAELGERLPLSGPGGLLVTVCAAAGDAREAARRRARCAGALAEDMEAFGVALACALAGVPLTVVRGASNEVGDRDHARWRIEEALESARGVFEELA